MYCANVSPSLIGLSDSRIFRNGSINNYTSHIKKREKDARFFSSSVSQANGFLVRENLSTDKFIATEIGHVPGQKWPHVIGKRSSFNHHSPVKVGYI